MFPAIIEQHPTDSIAGHCYCFLTDNDLLFIPAAPKTTLYVPVSTADIEKVVEEGYIQKAVPNTLPLVHEAWFINKMADLD